MQKGVNSLGPEGAVGNWYPKVYSDAAEAGMARCMIACQRWQDLRHLLGLSDERFPLGSSVLAKGRHLGEVRVCWE